MMFSSYSQGLQMLDKRTNVLKRKLNQAAKHRRASSVLPKCWRHSFLCVLYSIHNLIRLNNCCSARWLPGGEKCPFSFCTLLRCPFPTNETGLKLLFLIVSYPTGLHLLMCQRSLVQAEKGWSFHSLLLFSRNTKSTVICHVFTDHLWDLMKLRRLWTHWRKLLLA